MSLFRNNPIRSAATAAVAITIAHYGTKFMSSLYAFQLTQTAIAIFAIAALLFMWVHSTYFSRAMESVLGPISSGL